MPGGTETMVDWRTRITLDPKVLVGKPILRGARLAVGFVLELKASGWTDDQILANYQGVTPEDIRACLAYAKDLLDQEQVFPFQGP